MFAARAPNYSRLCFGRIFANYFLWVIATTGLFGEETAQYECRIFMPNTFLGDTEVKEKMKLNEIGIIDTGWVNSQFSSSWYVNCHQLYSYEFLAK